MGGINEDTIDRIGSLMNKFIDTACDPATQIDMIETLSAVCWFYGAIIQNAIDICKREGDVEEVPPELFAAVDVNDLLRYRLLDMLAHGDSKDGPPKDKAGRRASNAVARRRAKSAASGAVPAAGSHRPVRVSPRDISRIKGGRPLGEPDATAQGGTPRTHPRRPQNNRQGKKARPRP